MVRNVTCYRGTRAGKQVKKREFAKRFKIHHIQSSQARRNLKYRGSRRSRNLKNCIYVRPGKPKASLQKDYHYVPPFFQSNVMSLAPKIDEVAYLVQNANFDLVCITGTWLQKHISNNIVDIAGLNLIRLDRKETIHGGVCIFIRDSIQFFILSDLSDDSLEVLCIKIRPSRLPKRNLGYYRWSCVSPSSSKKFYYVGLFDESINRFGI